MVRFLSIVILSAFLTHLGGIYIYFIVRQSQIRQEMREAIGSLPSEEFETFTFTEEEYSKVRVNDHEIKISGRMYDHSSPRFIDGKIVLFARHDKAEDNLISLFKELINTSSQDQKPIPSQLSNFLSLAFIPSHHLNITRNSEPIKLIDTYSANFVHEFFPVESPPPKAII